MNEQPKKQDKEKPQKERFKEAAHAIGADEASDALDRAFRKLNPTAPQKRSRDKSG